MRATQADTERHAADAGNSRDARDFRGMDCGRAAWLVDTTAASEAHRCGGRGRQSFCRGHSSHAVIRVYSKSLPVLRFDDQHAGAVAVDLSPLMSCLMDSDAPFGALGRE
jgi:hypothetical protein